MDESMDDALEGWELDRAQASARDTAPIVATMCRELHNRGLDQIDASFLAAAWTFGIEHPGEEKGHG